MRVVRKRIAILMVTCIMMSWISVNGYGEEKKAQAKFFFDDEIITQETFVGYEDITDLMLGYKATYIADDAFLNLPNLTGVHVSGNRHFCSWGDNLYTGDKRELIYVAPKVKQVNIYPELRSVRQYALVNASQEIIDEVNRIIEKNWVKDHPTPKPTVTPFVYVEPPYPTPHVAKGNTLYDQMTAAQKKDVKKRLKLTKKTKPFLKYCGLDEYNNIYFHYYGNEEKVLHIPYGVQEIFGLSPDFWTHNTSVEEIVMTDRLPYTFLWTIFNRARYKYDKSYYYPFYFCDNLKKIRLIKTKWYLLKHELTTNKKGTKLYYNDKKIWQYGKKIAISV